jgi:ABC-type glycerol-3-phosphate transport system substrate-binding protein
MKRSAWILGIAAAITLSACGGGGGGASSSASPSGTAPPVTPAQTDFTGFVKDQMEVQPTAAPVDVSNTTFSMTNDDPGAFDDVIAKSE